MLIERSSKRLIVVLSACAIIGASHPVYAVNLTPDKGTTTLEKDSSSDNTEQNVGSGNVLSPDDDSEFERSNEILNGKFLV